MTMTTNTSPYGEYLPIFPSFYGRRPTEDYLERVVEKLVDRADAHFLARRATQDQYNAWTAALHRWVENVKVEQ